MKIATAVALGGWFTPSQFHVGYYWRQSRPLCWLKDSRLVNFTLSITETRLLQPLLASALGLTSRRVKVNGYWSWTVAAFASADWRLVRLTLRYWRWLKPFSWISRVIYFWRWSQPLWWISQSHLVRFTLDVSDGDRSLCIATSQFPVRYFWWWLKPFFLDLWFISSQFHVRYLWQ